MARKPKSNAKPREVEAVTPTVTESKTKTIEDIAINFPKNPTLLQRVLGKLVLGVTWVKITREVPVDE